MDATPVTVETHLPGGLPAFTLVGMPETAVREARDRVRSALTNCGFEFPAGRVVVNLAPADLTKEGARFDLAIAVSVLCATGQLPHSRLQDFEFLGELSLAGELRATRGSLCAALALVPGRRLVVPHASLNEARLAGSRVVACAHLEEVVRLLRGNEVPPAPTDAADVPVPHTGDLDQVVGQPAAKRALTVAAAGGHHLLMMGPPGSGKTLLSRGLRELLPPLNERQALAVAAVHSAAGEALPAWRQPPFRAPHHSASAAALVGGGGIPRPGEISLAHQGVLFLDELPHFKPSVLDHLREPLETGVIALARARARASFPAQFQLIAAMNPCPAGLNCDSPQGPLCRCTPQQAARYRARISGPLLDRIDLHVAVPAVAADALLRGCATDAGGESGALRDAVDRARQRQLRRQGRLNQQLSGAELHRHCRLEAAGEALLLRAAAGYGLSGRGVHRVLRVARTVADLEGLQRPDTTALKEALSYRSLLADEQQAAIAG